MSQEIALRQLIRTRAIARRERERAQRQLLPAEQDHKATIEHKLEGLNDTAQFHNFCRCGMEEIYSTCHDCRAVEKFTYRCNLKWCPRCQWRLSEARKKLIGLWAQRIKQPKHLVLTQRNIPILTRRALKIHTLNLAKIRRAKCFKRVRGGCVSVEITNEGNGWHIHSHWLIDCRWLDMPSVSVAWGKLVKQQFAIVKIMDVREKQYLQEVTKYVVEGSEIASWPPDQINEFVKAIRGRRFFFPFGSMFHEAPQIRKALAQLKKPGRICECGCDEFHYETEADAVLSEIRKLEKRKR